MRQPSLWEKAVRCRCLWISIFLPGEHVPTACFSSSIYRFQDTDLLRARRRNLPSKEARFEEACLTCMCVCMCMHVYVCVCLCVCVSVCLMHCVCELNHPSLPHHRSVEITDWIRLTFFDSLNPSLFYRNISKLELGGLEVLS